MKTLTITRNKPKHLLGVELTEKNRTAFWKWIKYGAAGLATIGVLAALCGNSTK